MRRDAGRGVERQCATAPDGAARDVFEAALKSADAETRTDVVGNQFGVFRLAGREDAALVMIGSHLDSQPKGGRFDRALGVAAAVCVGEALMEARRGGAVFDADFCAVNWTNEEGARFRPSLLGSGVFVGRHEAKDALLATDDAGLTLPRRSMRSADTEPTGPLLCRPATSNCTSSRVPRDGGRDHRRRDAQR